jgi:hypothetical protein
MEFQELQDSEAAPGLSDFCEAKYMSELSVVELTRESPFYIKHE